jgi:hypothetical protein
VQRIELRGCLPALLVLALLAAVAVAFVAAGVALALPLLALLFVVGAVRTIWRAMTGRSIGHGPGGAGRGPPPPGTIEVVDREPMGPVVDVGPPPRRDGLDRPPDGGASGPGSPGA